MGSPGSDASLGAFVTFNSRHRDEQTMLPGFALLGLVAMGYLRAIPDE